MDIPGMVTTEQITNLGTIDAETDFEPRFFVPSTTWDSVRMRKRPLVVGRKGTGKTALRFALKAEARSNPQLFVTDLAFRDYPWAVHYNIFDPNLSGRSRYQETWLFLMLVELSKLRVHGDQQPPSPAAQDAYRAIEKFLGDTWGGPTFDHRDTFRQQRFTVTKASLAPSVMGNSLGSIDWTTVDRNTLGDALTGMNRWLKVALENVMDSESEYILVFDELDLDFSPNDESYLDSMIGLVLAAQNLHLWARDTGLAVGVVVLLRDDIYADLNFPDKNKISMNLVETIHWSPDLRGSNSLKSVIDRRIAVLLDKEDVDDAWHLLFDEELMRGTQHKYAHMVQRTYLRPRDIIQFANECIKQARAAGTLQAGGRIANADVTAARTPYSQYLRNELNDEIHAHFPTWELWLDLLRRLGGMTFTPQAFRDEVARSGARVTGGAEPGTILEALYRFGVIGFARRGGRGKGGTIEYWAYVNTDVTFDPDAPYFKVHQGLKENLDLKEGEERRQR